jgi:hypothetical protein
LNDGASSESGAGEPVQRPAMGACAPIFLPVRYSASDARSSGESAEPGTFMIPLVSASTIRFGDIERSAARDGARVAGFS